MQVTAETRANEKDIVLMQKGMLPTTKKQSSHLDSEQKSKKPTKLGPSTIRTLIRAAESRKDWILLITNTNEQRMSEVKEDQDCDDYSLITNTKII